MEKLQGERNISFPRADTPNYSSAANVAPAVAIVFPDVCWYFEIKYQFLCKQPQVRGERTTSKIAGSGRASGSGSLSLTPAQLNWELSTEIRGRRRAQNPEPSRWRRRMAPAMTCPALPCPTWVVYLAALWKYPMLWANTRCIHIHIQHNRIHNLSPKMQRDEKLTRHCHSHKCTTSSSLWAQKSFRSSLGTDCLYVDVHIYIYRI